MASVPNLVVSKVEAAVLAATERFAKGVCDPTDLGLAPAMSAFRDYAEGVVMLLTSPESPPDGPPAKAD